MKIYICRDKNVLVVQDGIKVCDFNFLDEIVEAAKENPKEAEGATKFVASLLSQLEDTKLGNLGVTLGEAVATGLVESVESFEALGEITL